MRIDLHSHVLPAVDDGPGSLEGAIELGRAAAADGTDVLAATPHLRPDHPRVEPARLASQVAALVAAFDRARVRLGVVAGGEVDVYWAQRAGEAELQQVSYAQRGRDLLVETPFQPLPPIFEDLLFRLTARGYRVLLAHPERNPTFQRDPGRLAALVKRGTLVQVTASTLAGGNSRGRRLARSLVSEGLAHVIASDAHAAGAPRGPELSAGVRVAERLAGARAEWMVTDAPAAILAGDPLPSPPAAARRGFRLRPG